MHGAEPAPEHADPPPENKPGPRQFSLKRLFLLTAAAGVIFAFLRAAPIWTAMALVASAISPLCLTATRRAARRTMLPETSLPAYGCLSLIAMFTGLVGIWFGLGALAMWFRAIVALLTGEEGDLP